MKKILDNFLTSGCDPDKVSSTLLTQIKFINFFTLVGVSSTFIFAILHITSGNRIVGWFEVAGCCLAVVNLLYFRISLNYRFASSAILIFMLLLLLFLLHTGGLKGTGIFWCYTFPLLAFFLKGKIHGFYYLLFFYVSTIASYFFYKHGIIPQFYYSFTEIRQMLSSLTAVSLLVFFYEQIRDDSAQKISLVEKDIVIKNIFDRQFEEAGQIQRAYIPKNEHQSGFIDIAGYYSPAMEIGGDYFDIFPLDEDRTGVIICDVSSKGIPAAMIMVKFRTMIRMIFDLNSYKPSRLFDFINKVISKEMSGHMFITSIYMVLDKKTSQIEYANAGHLPMTIFSARSKEVQTTRAIDLPIGISPDHVYRNHEGSVFPGDIIVLYTDGINEMENPGKEMYGRERFHSQIKKYAECPAKEISEHLIRELFLFSKGSKQNDDIALVVIKIQNQG